MNFERHASGILQACPRKACLKHAFLWQKFSPKYAFCGQCLQHVQALLWAFLTMKGMPDLGKLPLSIPDENMTKVKFPLAAWCVLVA